jgi:DNA-binding MarR family transcriptional regulator
VSHAIKLQEAHKIATLLPNLMRRLFTLDDDLTQDLPLAQLRVCAILREGPRQMTTLSRELGISLSAMTQIADRLEHAKLVDRVPDRNDRRIRCLKLTPEAEKMMLLRENSRIQSILTVLNNIPSGARKDILAALETFMNACLAVNSDSLTNKPPQKVCTLSDTIC